MPDRVRGGLSDKTALLIYCTREEAQQIRTAAKRERRTISGFVLNAVMSRFAVEGRLQKKLQENLSRIHGGD